MDAVLLGAVNKVLNSIPIAKATYNSLIKLTAFASDVTISSNSQVYDPINIYKTLIINDGVELSSNLKVPAIILCDTLNLNASGALKSNPPTSSLSNVNGGRPGRGTGSLIVIAKTILGTGSIKVDGEDGVSPTDITTSNTTQGTTGVDGAFFKALFGTGAVKGGTGGNAGTNNAIPSGGALGSDVKNAIFKLLNTSWITELSVSNNYDFYGANGGYGGKNISDTYKVTGGAGGAGLGGSGGSGGNTDGTGGAGSGGEGGGGAGLLYIMSENPIPNINISANGGNGSSAYGTTAGGGGGGGAGSIFCFAPSILATITANGGAGGESVGAGIDGTNGDSGQIYKSLL